MLFAAVVLLLVKAEAESEASIKLSAAASQMMQNPAALELRRMQMIAEVGAENNSTTVLMIPSDFVSLAQTFNQVLRVGATSRVAAPYRCRETANSR
jgi:regulator of protease activity HflC (stomatin/prohibitin superfamily)